MVDFYPKGDPPGLCGGCVHFLPVVGVLSSVFTSATGMHAHFDSQLCRPSTVGLLIWLF